MEEYIDPSESEKDRNLRKAIDDALGKTDENIKRKNAFKKMMDEWYNNKLTNKNLIRDVENRMN